MGQKRGRLLVESITGCNVVMVHQLLNRLDEAKTQLLEAVALDKAIDHPDPESDREALEEVRTARRAQAIDSWPAP